jgi:hypothetical protein
MAFHARSRSEITDTPCQPTPALSSGNRTGIAGVSLTAESRQMTRRAASRKRAAADRESSLVWHDRPMSKQKADALPAGPVEKIRWLDDVADHDYASAEAYLSLKLDDADAHKTVKRLRGAELTRRRANDILRAAGLSPAPLDDPGVMKDLIKVIEGKALSPVLVVGADIADGYHRVSLVYRIDPYGEVPLKLVAKLP